MLVSLYQNRQGLLTKRKGRSSPISTLKSSVYTFHMMFQFSTEKSVRNWYALDDVVMGGVSASAMSYAGDGLARFHGRVSLENGGGFASVRYDKTSFDLSTFTGTELRVRGDGRTYQLRLSNPGSRAAYTQHFLTNPDWTTVRLPFSGFSPTFRGRSAQGAPPLNPADVTAVTLMLSDKQAGDFELWVDWLRGYGE